MKSYKGYNKLPYCVTHYPTTKFTAVVDTPENKRLAKQQQNQSDLIYRKDRKSALEGFTQVADSVASRQAAHSAKIASNINYQTAPHQVGREGKAVGEIVNRKSGSDMAAQQSLPVPLEPAADPIVEKVAAEVSRVYIEPPSEPALPYDSVEKFVAMYDYTAADDDEVTFVEGDVIVDGVPIDEGWMEGRVVRTGQYGMLPSNYVQRV